MVHVKKERKKGEVRNRRNSIKEEKPGDYAWVRVCLWEASWNFPAGYPQDVYPQDVYPPAATTPRLPQPPEGCS